MVQRALVWLRAVSDLGRMWLMSRRPHIEETLPDFGSGLFVAIATRRPLQPGEPVYGTPAYKAVQAGERYWIFVEAGDYWVYAVPGGDPQVALRDFYANPDAPLLITSGAPSLPGFRAELSAAS